MSTPNNTPKLPEKPAQKVSTGLQTLSEGMSEFFHDLIDIRQGQDREGTIIDIKKNMRMRGANAWLLMCSIMIASLGLDLNSPAVIIGAMLISPLMSPILGIGLAVGINDRNTLWISLQHFGVSIAIALVTSTLYFLLTPIGEMTNEISNRTAPTLLDAFVAFFGGIAGIISGTRKDKSNAIPGVAIATALMPPLCVTGFGFANLLKYGTVRDSFQTITDLNNWEIVINSFYLFFLNAVLVALATYLIVRWLRFPEKAFQDAREKRRTQQFIFIFSMFLVLYSVTILSDVIQEIRTDNEVKSALRHCFGDAQKYVDDWEKIKTEDGYDLIVKIYGPSVARDIPAFEEELKQKLPEFGSVDLIPTTEIDLNKFKAIEAQYSEVERLDSIIQKMVIQPRLKRDLQVAGLQNEINRLQSDSLTEFRIKQGIMALYEDYLEEVHYYNYPVDTVAKKYPLLSLRWKKDKANTQVEKRLYNYVLKMSGRDTLLISSPNPQ